MIGYTWRVCDLLDRARLSGILRIVVPAVPAGERA